MNGRIRAAAALLLAVAAITGLGASPAAAAVDLQAAVIDSPGPGWAPTYSVGGVPSGPITEEGEFAPQGYTPPPGPFLGGWAKWYEAPNQMAVLGILVGEYRDAPTARRANTQGREDIPVDLDEWSDTPADLPNAWGGTGVMTDDGVQVTSHLLTFTHGPLAVILTSAGPTPGPDTASLMAAARAEYAHLQAVVPASVVEASETGSSGLTDFLQRVGMRAAIGAALGLVGGGMAMRGKRRKGRKGGVDYPPVPAYGAPAYGAPAYGAYPPPPSGGGFGHLPPAPSGWGEPAWSSPGAAPPPPPGTLPPPPAGYAPPPPPAGYAPPPPAGHAPPPPPPAGPGYAAPPPPHPAAAPAPAAPVALAEQPPCARCGQDFGRGVECQSGCGAPRKACLVCGTKIWAGALTCQAHSGRV